METYGFSFKNSPRQNSLSRLLFMVFSMRPTDKPLFRSSFGVAMHFSLLLIELAALDLAFARECDGICIAAPAVVDIVGGGVVLVAVIMAVLLDDKSRDRFVLADNIFFLGNAAVGEPSRDDALRTLGFSVATVFSWPPPLCL